MWELVFFAVGGCIAVGVRLSGRRSDLQVWRAAAEKCGLQIEDDSGPWAWRIGIKAKTGSLSVSIETSRHKERDTLIVAMIPGPPGFLGVTIHSRSPLHPLRAAHEIDLGAPEFKRRFSIGGSERLLAALLDAETRRLLINIHPEIRLEIARGQLRAELMVEQTTDFLPLLLAVGRQLAKPLDTVERLVENARKDPQAGVRLHNLRLLIRELPGDPKIVATLHDACRDSSPAVRLCAAKNLGAEGHGVLLKLAEGLEDDKVSAEAVSLLGPALPPDNAREILANALRRRHLQTARSCLEQLARNGDPADVDLLAKVLARETGELAVAAATALGHLGTTATVMLLKEAAERNPRDHDLLKATRQAIAEIQSRLPGASPGQLSLASTEAGHLSLVSAEAGQLSLATDPEGRLSLSGGKEEG